MPLRAPAAFWAAAGELFEKSEKDFVGRHHDRDLLAASSSYSLIARKILDDMGIPERTERRSE